MNTSQKWLLAIGTSLSLAAVSVQAAPHQHSGRGAQDGKAQGAMNHGSHGKHGTGANRMSSQNQGGHQHGANTASRGQHRQMADASRTQRQGNATHQHEQGNHSNQNRGHGPQSHQGSHSH